MTSRYDSPTYDPSINRPLRQHFGRSREGRHEPFPFNSQDLREFQNAPTGGPQRFSRRPNQISDVERDRSRPLPRAPMRPDTPLRAPVQPPMHPSQEGLWDTPVIEDRRRFPRLEYMPPLRAPIGDRRYLRDLGYTHEEEDVPWWRRIGSEVGQTMLPMGQEGENLRLAAQLPMGLLDLITRIGHQFGGPETLGGEEGFLPPRTGFEEFLRSFPTLGRVYPGGAQRPMTEAEGILNLATMGLGSLGGTIGRRLGQVGRRPATSLDSWIERYGKPPTPIRRTPEFAPPPRRTPEDMTSSLDSWIEAYGKPRTPIRRTPEFSEALERLRQDIPRSPVRRSPEFAERQRKQFGGLLSDWEQGR
jgi:hypothetical protein